jgi:hypothetical protein
MEDQAVQQEEAADDSAKSDGLLYHYTDQKGLLGILDSKSIWATHVRYLNDASEFVHGINIASQCVKDAEISLESVLRDYPDDLSRRSASHHIWNIISKDFSLMLNSLSEIPVYVACFFDSEAEEHLSGSRGVGDSLGQWRAYSKGLAGFSIGFDKELLKDHIKRRQAEPEDSLLFGEKCIYDEKEQRETLMEESADIGPALVEFIKRAWNDFDENQRSDVIKEAKKKILKEGSEKAYSMTRTLEIPTIKDFLIRRAAAYDEPLHRIALKMAIPAVFMKHLAFREEREWRIAKVFSPKPMDVNFRPGMSSLVPYIAIPLPILNENGSSLIRRIIVGPSPEIENAVAATKMLLASKGYKIRHSRDDEGVEVVSSKIPYRNW